MREGGGALREGAGGLRGGDRALRGGDGSLRGGARGLREGDEGLRGGDGALRGGIFQCFWAIGASLLSWGPMGLACQVPRITCRVMMMLSRCGF